MKNFYEKQMSKLKLEIININKKLEEMTKQFNDNIDHCQNSSRAVL